MANDLQRVVAAARRRLWRAELERGLARWLRHALLLAVVLLAVDRLWRLRFEPWYPILGLLAGASLAGVLAASRRRPDAVAAAAALDARLGLKERLSSAVALHGHRETPLLAPLLADAERHAAAIEVREALRAAPSFETRLCAGLVLALVVVSLLPQITFWRSETSVATELVTRQVGSELLALAEQVEQQASERGAARARLEARRLMREALALRRARLSKPQALRRMERLRQELQTAREEAAGHPLRRTAETARRDLRQVEGALGEVGRELEDQRLEAAAELLRELARQAHEGELGREQAKQLAEQSKQAAEALRDSPYDRQGKALQRAAEALERAAETGSPQALGEAAEALEQAADGLSQGALESADEELLRDLQEHLEHGKDAVGEAERLKREADGSGGELPGDLTDGKGRGGGGVNRGPGSTNEDAGEGGSGGGQMPQGEVPSPPDLGPAEFESLYAPRRAETLQRDRRAGAAPQRRGGYAHTQGPRGSLGLQDSRVPYDRVLQDYAAAADRAVNEGDIPLVQRQRVRRYFDDLRQPIQNRDGR